MIERQIGIPEPYPPSIWLAQFGLGAFGAFSALVAFGLISLGFVFGGDPGTALIASGTLFVLWALLAGSKLVRLSIADRYDWKRYRAESNSQQLGAIVLGGLALVAALVWGLGRYAC